MKEVKESVEIWPKVRTRVAAEAKEGESTNNDNTTMQTRYDSAWVLCVAWNFPPWRKIFGAAEIDSAPAFLLTPRACRVRA